MTVAGISNLVVEVLHNRGDDNHPDWSVGSGFFVGTKLVLTALHNVDGPGELLVRVHGTEEHPAVVRLQDNEDKVDLAVLEVSDVVVDVPPLGYGEVDRRVAKVVKECWAVGFPQFKVLEHERGKPKPPPSSAQVNGEIPTGEYLGQQLLTLQVGKFPRAQSQGSEWEGMSGAVVFSGDYIVVGVITEHHRPEGESALTVVPITAINLLPEVEATKWWNLLGVDHRALVRLPGEAPSSLSQGKRQIRTFLLNRVRERWIDGVLEPSLHLKPLIDLNLRFQVQETNRPPYLLTAGTSIVQVYDKADGGLLILGKPGTGKTTLLLELTRVLLERAEHDQDQRMPIYFHLSSWAEKRLPLSEWLIEELGTKYHIKDTIGKAWVNTGQILPLLDGLDEVVEPARPSCVQAINTYFEQHQDNGPIPIVVSCRRKDYLALPTRVELSHAVSIRPLTSGQIRDYLQSAGNQLEALRLALHTDRKLCVLARYPLMLSIFTLAYKEATRADLPTEGVHEARLRQIFGTFVERMLTHHRQKDLRQGTHEQFKHWLASLASHMQQQHQTEFYIERMQPDWLPDNRSRRVYQIVCGLIGGLLVWLIFGLVFGLAIMPSFVEFGLVGVLAALGLGLVFGLFFGLVFGLAVGLSKAQRIKILLPVQIFVNSPPGIQYGIRYGIRSGLFLGLLIGLVGGLLAGLVAGLVGGLLAGLVGGLLVWLAFGLVSGLSGKQLSEHNLDRPNQGVWLTLRNGLFAGLFVGLFVGLINGLGGRLGDGLFVGLFVGLLFWLLAWLFLGGNAFIRHFVLRWFLWRARSMPWKLVPFLDEAAERLLLRKVGGGYIFVHRLLLDYFASLEKKES